LEYFKLLYLKEIKSDRLRGLFTKKWDGKKIRAFFPICCSILTQEVLSDEFRVIEWCLLSYL